MKQWQTKQQLVDLLCKLVRIPSVTGSQAEVTIAENIVESLAALPYFQNHPEQLMLHPTGDNRRIVTALVKKNPVVKQTVILMSHFDVVDVEDYGILKPHAFDPYRLTHMFQEQLQQLPKDAQHQVKNGNWLFGRGIMDMKCGLALHMSMIEKAAYGEFDGNVLLLTVCDEEVNSVGMRTAVPVLLDIAKKYGLDYTAILNSEPMFTRYPGDENHYIYSGSIGKILPGFLCYGKETHVGEPFSGLNANFMASALTFEMELNTEFCEVSGEEVTPPPTNLLQKDLKGQYSVQVPHRAVTLFNLFLYEKPIHEVVQHLYTFAKQVAQKIEQGYSKQAQRFTKLEYSNPQTIQVKVLHIAELLEYAVSLHGKETVKNIQAELLKNLGEHDDRDLSIRFADQLAILCKELAPMIILFFSPPFYPAITSYKDPRIQKVTEEIIHYANETHHIDLKSLHYFGGISDLSYAGLQQSASSLQTYLVNMPLWDQGYTIPLKSIMDLNLPVINIGPIGKDAHKWTERLDIDYAFDILPEMIKKAIHSLLE